MATRGKNTDWFEGLEKELDEKIRKYSTDITEWTSKKRELNALLLKDFARIQLKFAEINVILSMEPSPEEWSMDWRTTDESYYTIKPGYDPALISGVVLKDTSPYQKRMGDSIIATYENMDGVDTFVLVFDYLDREEYNKFTGWNKIRVSYTLYEAPVKEVDVDKVHSVLADAIRVWFESHLKKDRTVLTEYVSKKYSVREQYSE